MKRVLSLAVVLTLSLTFLVGCAGNDEDENRQLEIAVTLQSFDIDLLRMR